MWLRLADISSCLHFAHTNLGLVHRSWDQKATGYGMAFSGAVSVTVDLGILPMLHRNRLLSELSTALLGGVLMSAGLSFVALGTNVRRFMIGLGILSLGTSLFKSALNVLIMVRAFQMRDMYSLLLAEGPRT